MKKVWIILGVALIAAAAAVMIVKVFLAHVRGNTMDGPGMVYEPEIRRVEYWYGGGMPGSMYRITLEGGTMTVETQQAHNLPAEKNTYDVGAGLYGTLWSIAEKGGMRNWTDLKKAEIFALDGPEYRLSVTFRDGTRTAFGSENDLPEGGDETVRSLIAALEAEMKD